MSESTAWLLQASAVIAAWELGKWLHRRFGDHKESR